MTNKGRNSEISYIRDIAKTLTDNYISENRGWGQFLDGRIQHRTKQYGRYGTSAGAIVLALSGKQDEQIASEIKNTLVDFFWNCSHKEKNCQNLVLGSLFAGISCLKSNTDDELKKLLDRRISNNLWGNYWISRDNYDQTESIFVSSIILVSISCANINNKIAPSFNSNLKKSLSALESHYLENTESHEEYKEVIFAALHSFDFYAPSQKIKNIVKRNAHNKIDLSKKYIYFYDYEKEESKVGREYFVIPLEIFSVLASTHKCAPASYVLRSNKIISLLKTNTKENNGLFISSTGTRASTLEQGYLALALYRSTQIPLNQSVSWCDKTVYHLKIDRDEKFYFFTILVVIAYLLAAINSYIISLDSGVAGKFEKLVVNSSIFIIAAIRDPKKLFKMIVGIKK